MHPRFGTAGVAQIGRAPDAWCRDQLASLADVASVGMAIADPALPDCPLVYVNAAFTKLTGYPAAEAVGRNCRFLQGPETDPAAVEMLRHGIRTKTAVTVQILNFRIDGTAFWSELIVNPVCDQDGRLGSFVSTFSDVTSHRQETAALQRATELAEAANEAKSHFVSNMSHELRTPLNAIIGFTEILKRDLSGKIDAKYADYVDTVLQSGRHLLDLVNDVLDQAKIEAGRLELHEDAIHLRIIIGEVVKLTSAQALSKGVHITVHKPIHARPVWADPRRVRQVLLNLMSNAIKFTPSGGVVMISTRATHDAVEIAVTDTGIGMTPEQTLVALTPFGQIEGSLTRSHEGTGLGLPIAKALMELHGGTLVVESKPRQGTVVTARFPKDCCLPSHT